VTVELSADGQPHFTIHENVAWDYIVADDAAGAFSEQADLVCFGTLAQRSPASRAAIQSLVSRTPEKALRVCDINLRQQFYSKDVLESSLALANVLKLNDQELLALASMFELRGDSREQLATLAQRFNLKVVALTRGAAGSLLLMDGHWSEHPGIRAKVKDTIGAGDAFSAALTLGLLAGRPLNAISAQANKLAAYVCTQPGATPLVGRQKSVVPDL
jgi:fructokinase